MYERGFDENVTSNDYYAHVNKSKNSANKQIDSRSIKANCDS